VDRLLTFEEFEQLPDRPGKDELLEGELMEPPPDEYLHNGRATDIYLLLRAALTAAHGRSEAGELGEARHEAGYRLGSRSYVQPDASVTHANHTVERYLCGAPAIAIEVIWSPNSAEVMDRKLHLCFLFGAREVWHVYPMTRRIVVHLPDSIRYEYQTVTTPLLPGFTLNIPEILPA
jgi:Uma2 family endonuclease